MTTYAVAADYATYKGLPYPGDWDEADIARIDAGLLSAQDDIDEVIRFSVYDVDDTETQTALTRATCARFDYAETTGDDGSGLVGSYDQVSIASVSLSRGSTAASASTRNLLVEKLGQKAVTILTNAGFFSSVVSHR